MDFNGILALIIIPALIVGGLALRQLLKSKRRRDSDPTSRTDNASGEENEALRRDSESTSGTDDAYGEKFDVFLSFRGSDTRLNFTDHLYHSMVIAGLQVFLDSEELEDGKRINEVLKAVDESRIYIPIFSRNFATSSWCLREVARMEECTSKSDGKKVIIPIFYDVKTDDVKLKTDLYKKAICKHKLNFFSFFGLKHKGKFDSHEVARWERALKVVGGLKGRVLEGKSHREEIESIVEQVSHKFNKRHKSVTEHLVEDSAQVKAIMKLLDVRSDGVCFVGIHGIGGVGKTTLAKVLHNKLSFHFDGCSFLDDVRVRWQSPGGCLELQKGLLSDYVSSKKTDRIKDVSDGIEMIKRVLSKKKVLIVLDDLNKKEQLEQLAGKSNWFGSGSRIIFTTRNKEVLMTQVELSGEEVLNQTKGILAYEVQRMEFNQAFRLFCKHAFRRVSPIKGYDHLAEKIVRRVDMLPLAIEVIGSSLYCSSFGPEQHLDKTKLWEETFKRLDEGPIKNVRDVLYISYEGLEDKQKEVFLDIACFFTNENQTYPVLMWEDCDYLPTRAIGVLLLRSLIKIRDNKFRMHDQVRDLGRNIVLKEYPRKFSRVWIHEDVIELLETKERNEDVEAISLTSSGSSHNFTDEELAALPKLRFLRAKGSDFSGDFQNLLLKLRWLSWQTWQTAFQAKNFHFGGLVVLNLSDSNIEDGWDGWSRMKMNKLKVLDLTGCRLLTRTPDFSKFTSLETLILARCVELTTIDGSIGELKLLRTFNIDGCRVLRKLPAKFGSLQSLTEIIMPQHYQHFKLPKTFGNLQSLSSFILDEHPGIKKLPNSIGRLVKLKRLSLCGCVGIKKLPGSIGEMKMLAELDLSKSGIVKLPNSIGSLKKLKVIRISYTVIRNFPQTIGHVIKLKELHAKKCWNLTDENLKKIGNLSNLRILDISYTGVTSFPTVLGCLSRLETLEMSSSHLQEVPNLPSSLTRLHMQAPRFPSILNLSSLVNLDHLELSILNGSMEEPDIARMNDSPEEQLIHLLPSSLSTLKLRGMRLLPPFSNLKQLSEMSIMEHPMSRFSISEDLTHLRILKLRKCKLLEKIPGLARLENLWCLDLNRLESMVEIHELLELKSLEHFRIAHCNEIESLPDLSKLDKLRHIEVEACSKIKEIKLDEGTESSKLDSRGCNILERLLDDPGSTWLFHRIPTYDVFLSFRGQDTRYSIVEILYKNLVRNKTLVYRDDEAVSHDSGISWELLLALDDSHIYIPFLSKDYASSQWCLHELARMVARKKSNGKRILPIFCDVEKEDVKLESNLYKDALSDHRKYHDNDDEVMEWEEALKYVGDMDGYHWTTNRESRKPITGEQTLGKRLQDPPQYFSLEGLIESVTEEVLKDLEGADIRRPQAVED